MAPTFIAIIDNMGAAYARALHQVSQLTVMIAKLHVCASDDPPGYDKYRAAALVVCARLVPPLKQLRAAVDDQLAAIDGTWQPPKN